MSLSIVEDWLNACSGCEISILNIGDALTDLIPHLEFRHMTALVDHKFFGQLGEGDSLEIPEADVGLVSGGVRNAEHLHELKCIRERVRVLIALGTCAAYGGVPAQANMWTPEEVFDKVFRGSPSTEAAPNPKSEHLPEWIPSCSALDEYVHVDIVIPGCPPHPDWIAEALLAVLNGATSWALPARSVCDTCPTMRERKESVPLRRFFDNAEFEAEKGLGAMRCLNEQGILCMGPVTLAGCAGRNGVPRCLQARTPCRGCFGPIRRGYRPAADMMGALASVGIDPRAVVDRRALLNRYIGGHGVLRPKPNPCTLDPSDDLLPGENLEGS